MDDITVIISSIFSNDAMGSVGALKVLGVWLENDPPPRTYQEHMEGLIETVTLQTAHVFEPSEDIALPENCCLAKCPIQTLNAFMPSLRKDSALPFYRQTIARMTK